MRRQITATEKDPTLFLNLNRVQSYKVVGLGNEMIVNNRPRTYAFIWYGKTGQGLEKFHAKLEKELNKMRIKLSKSIL